MWLCLNFLSGDADFRLKKTEAMDKSCCSTNLNVARKLDLTFRDQICIQLKL